MKHAVTQELFSYWDHLRGQRTAPERADIDPGAIRGVLADTFILDISEPAEMPLRIAGARLNALFNMELKSHDFVNLWSGQSRQSLLELASNVAGEPAPAIAGVKAAAPGRHPPLDMELLLLPLRHFGKTHLRLLGCLSPAAVPYWLGLIPVTGLALGPMRIVRPASFQSGEFLHSGGNKGKELPVRHGHLHVHAGGNNVQSEVLERS